LIIYKSNKLDIVQFQTDKASIIIIISQSLIISMVLYWDGWSLRIWFQKAHFLSHTVKPFIMGIHFQLLRTHRIVVFKKYNLHVNIICTHPWSLYSL